MLEPSPHRANPNQPLTLTLASIILIASVLAITCVVTTGVAFDIIAGQFKPWSVLFAATIEMLGLGIWVGRRRIIQIMTQFDELVGFLLLVGIVSAYLIYPSLPGLLPPARHYDAVNHVLLADSIFNQNALPRDATNTARPYHLNGYPAGGALLGALVAHWIGSTPIQTIHPLISIVLGLAAGLVFIYICRLLPQQRGAKPVAFLATMLLFTAWEYFPGSLNQRYFYAQVFSQFFALATFFFAYIYWRQPNRYSAALMAIMVGMVLLSHPTPIIAPTLVALAAIGLHPSSAWKTKVEHGAIWGIGVLIYVIAYVLPHLTQWVQLTGLGEAVSLAPDTLGVTLPTLGILGAMLAWRAKWKNFRLAIVLVAAVLAQPIGLALARLWIPNLTDYYFDKALYLLIYPLVILAAVPLAALAQSVRLESNSRLPFAWGAVIALSGIIVVFFPPRPFAPLTPSQLGVAEWVAQNLDKNNVESVSNIREDSYWIHLLLFDQPPASRPTIAAYFLGSMTYDEWRGNPAQPDYAIIRNTTRIPPDPTVETIHRIGDSAVVKKPHAELPYPIPNVIQAQFGDVFQLVDVTPRKWELGKPVTLTFSWFPLRWHTTRLSMFVQVLDGSGNVVARVENEMFQQKYPTQRWQLETVVTDTWQLPLDKYFPPITYSVEIAIYEKQSGARLDVSLTDSMHDDKLSLGEFLAIMAPPSNSELAALTPVNALFGNQILLRGYTLESNDLKPGSKLRLMLYWQSVNPAPPLTVFVHLVDAQDRLIAQYDAQPQRGARPTDRWQSGDLVADPYQLALPDDVPPGTYHIRLGLYNPLNLQRVPVAQTDYLTIATPINIR